MLLRQPSPSTCWICYSEKNPSREHKIKASDLRRHFGAEVMVVSGGDFDRARTAQGPNSSHLKYASTICESCNSSITQESDRAYDKLIGHIEGVDRNDEVISQVFNDPRFRQGSELYIPLFRYFAKLLGCHLADIGAPIPVHLSRFVRKKNDKNCIWLQVRQDVEFQRITSEFSIPDLRYAAHGGLVVITKTPKFLPIRLHTTLTVGPIQFVFMYAFTIFEIWEMRLRYPKFVQWCATTARSTIDNPIPQELLHQLGFE